MPKILATPANHVPGQHELLQHIQRHPGCSLRSIAGSCWPGLPWYSANDEDSATSTIYGWQVPPRPGAAGNRLRRATAAAWLHDELQELVLRGLVRHAPRHQEEVDDLAACAYQAAVADVPASRVLVACRPSDLAVLDGGPR